VVNEFLLKEFGERIKSLRAKKNISQESLANLTGFHRTYIGMVERGERNISLINIAVFAKVFQMSISELLDLSFVNNSRTFSDYETKSEA
jgi:transcriptional regulator with XRE-family HTH domain